MARRSLWGQTPRQSIDSACALHGQETVLRACADLLARREIDPSMVTALGGPHADRVVDSATQQYWLRVWATRGLLWAYEDSVQPSLTRALRDEHWRVREMALKVVARHRVDDALPAVSDLQHDRVARVRAAAARALVRLTDPQTNSAPGPPTRP